MKTAIIAVALCLCLLLAPQADAQADGLVNTVIKGCTSGMTSTLCKGAVSRATALCKAPNGGGNCISMLTDLCRVSWRRGTVYYACIGLEEALIWLLVTRVRECSTRCIALAGCLPSIHALSIITCDQQQPLDRGAARFLLLLTGCICSLLLHVLLPTHRRTSPSARRCLGPCARQQAPTPASAAWR